jgi:hypothetical protein
MSSNERLEKLRHAWTSEIDPDDYDTHMRAIGQGPTNADLSREMIERNPPAEGKTILIPGAGSGQMFDFVDSGFLFGYQVTFSDISQPFLDALKPRIEFAGLGRSRVVVDDLAASKLEGPYAGALVVLVLENLDWRAALASLNSLVTDVLWIVIQKNPESMTTSVTPGRELPGTMAVVSTSVHPELINEVELTDALAAYGFAQTVRAPRPVDDGKEMVGLVFRRNAP